MSDTPKKGAATPITEASTTSNATADTASTAPANAATPATPASDTVDCVARGSFHELDNMQGKVLQAGETFTTTRQRAVELRANGLVSYADETAEKDAAAEDPEPSTENGVPVITTRSMRRAK